MKAQIKDYVKKLCTGRKPSKDNVLSVHGHQHAGCGPHEHLSITPTTKLTKRFLNKRLRGVAILTVMVSLALLMAIVTELSTKETVRYKLAINERDALQAEALAESGANFARLLLTLQEPLSGYLANLAKLGVDLPAYTVGELMSIIDSDLLKGITDGSFMPDFGLASANKEEIEENKKTLISEKSKDLPLFGPYKPPEGGYGGFLGRFSTEIEDEEKRISLRKWPSLSPVKRKLIAELIFKELSKPENAILFNEQNARRKNISPSELVGNIYDYISEEDRAVDVSASKENWGRDLAGDKRSKYADSGQIVPKRAYFDSIAELRLVPGMTDAIFSKLSKFLTIYGESDKINILSASDEVVSLIFYLCAKNKESGQFLEPGFEANLLSEWKRKKSEGGLSLSAEGVITHLEENAVEVDKDECNKTVGTESKTFTVKSTATVGTVTKTLIMRLRSAGGTMTLYQFQYL